MKKVILALSLFTVYALQAYAQKQATFKIQLETDIVGDRLKVYEDQFRSYVLNELAKIPDVKHLDFNPAYYLHITLFAIPCKCTGYDFYYRAHFFKKDFKDAQVLSPMPITEGFSSTAALEDLSKDIVAAVNTRSLQKLR